MRELLDSHPAAPSSPRATSTANVAASMRATSFVAISVGVHVVLSLALPREAQTLARAASPAPVESFFELEPAEPPPAPEPPPVVEEPPPEPVTRVVRAVPSSDPPAADPAATPAASEVVPDSEPVVQEATVVSTTGGLAVAATAGTGNGGALAGTRHDGPIGTAAPTREERRADLSEAYRAYRALVFSELRPHLRTPRAIGREEEARTVKLAITVDASGRVLSVRLRESCGTEHLDELALESLRAVAHVSAPPSELLPTWQHPREIIFPVSYHQ